MLLNASENDCSILRLTSMCQEKGLEKQYVHVITI